MIKALFFDLDGTLLTGKKTVSDANRKAIARCRENGIKVFLATARSPMLDRMLGWTDEELSLFDGGVYCNGALIATEQEKTYDYLPAEAVRACIEEVARFQDVHFALHVENEVHIFNHPMPDLALGFWGIDRADIASLDAEWYDRTVKILIYRDSMMDAEKPLPEVLYERIMVRCGDKANICLTDQGKTIIAVSRDAGKYPAIEKLRLKLKFEKDEIAVFGDDFNDKEMLSGYKNSVAMGNAADELKKIAGYITLTNEEDGVAYALENILEII